MRQAEEVEATGSGTAQAPGGAEEVGRRERKKAQTRQALVDAALDLFRERGYAATTIEDITERVDVSPRTFFRYFPSKEAVVFADKDVVGDTLAAALADRPDDEPVLESIRAALHEVVDEVEADPQQARFLAELCRDNPSLEEYRQQIGGLEAEEALLGFLRGRLADPIAPTIIAAALKAAMAAAWEHWVADGEHGDMQDMLDHAIDALEAGFGRR